MSESTSETPQQEETGSQITGAEKKTLLEKTFREKNSEAGHRQYYEKDHWRSTGETFIKGDHLCFLPQQEIARTHHVSEDVYREDGYNTGTYRSNFVDVDEKRVERGIQLTMDVNDESVDPQNKKLP